MTYGFDTRCIHGESGSEGLTGAITYPIFQTSTFEQSEIGGKPEFCYARTGNPTRSVLERNLATVENAKHGLAFASGMAAINNALNLLSAGDHVVACLDLYGGAYRIFTKLYAKFGVEFTFVDTTDPVNVARAIRDNTRIVWLESPSNPLLRITDIDACAKIGRRAGARVVVDNTFATPCLQAPLELGADIVVHSTTKYLSGHGDVLGGALLTNSDELFERLKFYQNAVGAVPGPQDCFLVLRGLKTLSLRVARHCDSAVKIAQYLSEHPAIERVHFPGLAEHPQHPVAKRQMKGFGAIVSFEARGGLEFVKDFVRRCRIWALAESLGSANSLLCHPPTMTHASVEPDVRRRNGIGDGLIRLSVGLEDLEDLVADLGQALDGAGTTSSAKDRRLVTSHV